MKFLRWVLGALVALWSLMNLLNVGMTGLHKLGKLPPLPEAEQRLVPLMEATPLWMLGLWGLFTLLLIMTAWRLFTGGRALGVYLLALGVHVALWWVMHRMPAYSAAFTPEEMSWDYYILAGEAVVALLIWLTGRRKAA
jgi:hypothetical protein